MKKIVIAMDSFKGSVSGVEAATAASRGVKAVLPDVEISAFSVSDGGEGLRFSLLMRSGSSRLIERFNR